MSQKESKKKLQLRDRVIFFATNNVDKFNEARRVLSGYNMAVGMLRVKSLEIQSESLEEIAVASVIDAFDKCRLPMIVEDTGLFVDALNGFPGPYSAYVYRTIGNQGLLRLMQSVKTRKARFRSVIAYLSSDMKSPKCFSGQVQGEIMPEERRGDGSSGFGFDPIFKPIRDGKTFAEMGISEKNKFSHRAEAFRAFAEWYKA
jgi:XTP/dITP diphosphohydrolase